MNQTTEVMHIGSGTEVMNIKVKQGSTRSTPKKLTKQQQKAEELREIANAKALEKEMTGVELKEETLPL